MMPSPPVEQQDPVLALAAISVLLILIFIDARIEGQRPLWLRLVSRAAAFAVLTWLMRFAVGSPLAPQIHAMTPALRFWVQLAEIGWWMMGARLGVAVLRLLIVLEDRPRETQIVSDLLAGAIYVATALSMVNFVLGVPIAGLVATSGVVAIVLGLALQSTLADVFSGITIGLERAYKPGDSLWVEGGVEGQVLQIHWRSTQIKTLHNTVAIVPNSVIAKSRLENRSAPTPARTVSVSIVVDAAADLRRCVAALEAAVAASGVSASDTKPTINCIELRGDGVTYEISFSVATGGEIADTRTTVLTLVHRHLRHAGVALGVNGSTAPAPVLVPSLAELIANSDTFGPIAADGRAVLAEHFVAVSHDGGDTIIRQDEQPSALFLLARGAVELVRTEGGVRRVLLRASPGDSLGTAGLMSGATSLYEATALTPVIAYSLELATLVALLHDRPELAASLERQAKRGQEWLRCQGAQTAEEAARPEMLLTRLRQLLQRLET